MIVPQTVLDTSHRWNEYARRRFVKQLEGGVSWLKSRCALWSDAQSFDAQITRHGDLYTVHITVGFVAPSPGPGWSEMPRNDLDTESVRKMVDANRKTTIGVHAVK